MVGGERPLPRTFQRSRWGQNSGGTAAPVHHCPRWLSKPKKGLGGDIRQLATRAPVPIPPHHSLKMCPCHKSTKTFVRQLSSLLLQLRTVTAHVRALWVWPRQHQILHVGYSHKTSNTVFLIYDYCVSVTNIAGVCKSIHRELGGRLGLEKPQKGEGGGFARAGG